MTHVKTPTQIGRVAKAMHNVEAESSVLAGLLHDNKLWADLGGKLREEDFFRHDHRIIFRAITKMITAGRSCDFVLLVDALRQRGQLEDAGGVPYLGNMANENYRAGNFMHYADLVREYSDRRQLYAAAHDVMDAAIEGTSSAELKAQLAGSMATIEVGERSVQSWSDVLSAAEARMKRAQARRAAGGTVGIPSSLHSLDQVLGGFGEGQVWVIAARPGTGKSALLNQIGIHAAQQGHPGLIVSLEMLAEEIGIRAMASASQRNVAKLFRGYAEDLEAGTNATIGQLGLPLWVETGQRTLEGITARISQLRARHHIQWAAIDHLGLVSCPGFHSRVDLIGHLSGTLKGLALRLGIPILLLAQMNRASVKEDRRPMLNDLRDSGRLEEDADGAIFLHQEADVESNFERVPISIGILKNRNGRSGFWLDEKIYFNGATQTFTEETSP